ncbi:MAG: fibronectin type III domain-containing protein, partial [Gemmatimonadetes bacterium]|nr:fibronectin type III domain-containing protein [Gemmatimonadota bacterium]
TTLRYYLSTDATITTGDTEVETDYVSRLAPSETSEESAYLNAPSSAGTYYYGACVEAVTGESDTGNNCSSAVTVTVGGTTPPPTPNQPPVFTEGASTTRSIAENTGAGQNIGNPISATDGDNDRLTYSLEGTDARAFTIISGSGQLRTRSGVTYDYETKNSYSVTVRVQDSKGGSATIAVTITLTDENETPSRPDAPTVTASTLNSLSVRWTAPTNSGSAISDYDVQYRATGGNFNDWPHTGTGTTTTITGLTANTRYEIQVRARNAQGVSNWSSSATGTTTANQSPVFSEGTNTTRSIAENTGAGQNIGNQVSATDGDNDRLTYSLEGRDASVFTIISGSGQLMTRSGQTYDYETKDRYSVTVRAQDGKGGSATIAVEITLTDENEPPGRPDAPTVTASSNSLSVRWVVPTNSGPAINDYDVQYREAGSNFTDWSHTSTSTNTTITGLTTDTSYEVQVRATNDEGTSDWSPSGNGTTSSTGANNPDLIVESPSVDNNTLSPEQSFRLSATVRNRGGERSASTTLRYYLSTDETISTSDTEVGTDYVSRLNASASSDEWARLKAPLSEGTHYYGACVESVSGESDTGNNCSSAVTVTVLGPDLIVESPSVSNSSPGPGASFRLYATVRNQGGGRSSSTTLRYYLSTDQTIDQSDTEIDTDYVSSLDPSETSDESDFLSAPSSAGRYYYGACVEAVTGESDTGNNCSSAVIVTVRSAPPPPAPNQSPVFSEGTSTTRSMAENTGAGQNIGNPVTATDGDNDRLTYSLQGGDASAFTIVSGSGQLRTRSGVTYDYETKDTYSVTVRVQDGEGGSATITVEITLTDENEPPDRPDAPVVTASTLNSLSLRWTAPTNPGPAISDYDVQYKEAGGSFTDWPHTGTGTTTTITSLTANTRYEIQVRARNAQGESPWSPSATGTTIANQSPMFSEGTSATRSIAENTGAGQNIGNPVSATDGDSDPITYSLAGRDASAFTIVSGSGQLSTQSGETYDYEIKDTYSVTVRAQDGKGGSATISVEITLTDENEPPGRPAAPTVTASSNSLSVRWAEPGNTGPVIRDYDVQYRATGGSFTDWSHIGPGLSTTITGLMPETSYEVQVRATNDEGTSDWSPSSNSTTSRPAPGFAPVDQNAFNTFVSDKVLSVESYYIEFLSAGRFEENNAYPGSYTYANTGSNTGILTQNYDGGHLGGTCTIEMTFSSTTTGTLRAKCGSEQNYDSPQEWRFSAPPDPNAFNIEVIWVGSEPSAAHQAAFNAAVTRWENIITSDIPDVFVSSDEGGTIDGVKIFGLVDDLRIYARLTNIDGPGETLGSAGPRETREQSKLPIVAQMKFDTSDLGNFTLEALQDLYLHEMGHCLGIGTAWKPLGLLKNPSIKYQFFIIPVEVDGADTHFAGASAIEAFNDAGGTNYADGKVPVENEKGGPGTRDGHWRQSVFGPHELMEGFASPGAAMRQPLSAITIQSLSDLGYIVDVSQADAYTLPSPTATKLAIASEHLIPINCLLTEPIGEIDEYKQIELKPKRSRIREDQ